MIELAPMDLLPCSVSEENIVSSSFNSQVH